MSIIRVESIDIRRGCVHVVFLGLPNVPGVAAEIFNNLSEQGVSVDMVTQTTMRGGRSDLSFLIEEDRLDEVVPLCRSISAKVSAQGVSFATEVAAITVATRPLEGGAKDADDSLSKVTLGTSQMLAKIFSALAAAGVNLEIINAGPASVVCVVSLTRAEQGVEALRRAFEDELNG